jgi:hypothetical protein
LFARQTNHATNFLQQLQQQHYKDVYIQDANYHACLAFGSWRLCRRCREQANSALERDESEELRLLQEEDTNFWGRQLWDGSMPSKPIGVKYVSISRWPCCCCLWLPGRTHSHICVLFQVADLGKYGTFELTTSLDDSKMNWKVNLRNIDELSDELNLPFDITALNYHLHQQWLELRMTMPLVVKNVDSQESGVSPEICMWARKWCESGNLQCHWPTSFAQGWQKHVHVFGCVRTRNV